MPNNFDLQGTPETTEDSLTELTSMMNVLGPKRVETKEFKAEQFSPLEVQKVIERRRTGYPTFNSCPSVVVSSQRAETDCCGDGETSCGCDV